MNAAIREAVRKRMKDLNVTQVALGAQVGMAQPNIQRLLAGRVAPVPDSWQKVLDALNLELVVVPKEENPE